MKRLILAGAGHAHLLVMEYLARHPAPGWEVVLLAAGTEHIYSGMIPGWIADEHDLSQCQVALRPLANASGVSWAGQPMLGVDAHRRCVWLANGQRIDYDLISLNTGAATDERLLLDSGDHLLPIKPLQDFTHRWTLFCRRMHETARAPKLVVVGGGAGGVELALAARERLGQEARIHLVTGWPGPLPGYSPKLRTRVHRQLGAAHIDCLDETAAGCAQGVILSSGRHLKADLVVAATGSMPPDWLALSKLALNDGGYIAVDACHRSISHEDAWAVGDVCSRVDTMLPHSGVHAVRAGAVLARNLHAAMTGGRFRPYRPHPWSLYLIRTRADHAIASFGPLSAEGAWVAAWKRRIDRRFVERFRIRSGRGATAS